MRTAVALAFCAIWSLGSARPWAHEQSDLEPDPAAVFGELPSGVRYVILPNVEPRGRVSLRLFVRAGSLNERDEQRGLAHYLEHMAFNGTEHFTPGSMVAYFQNLGMAFGPDANAYTGFERTVYQIELPDNSIESIDEALFVLREYVDRMLVDEDEIESERGVILSEMRTRDTVGYRTALEEFSFLLPEAIVAERFPIGTEEVIRSADRDVLLAFYESWYRPERTKIVIVGEVEPGAVEPAIEARFADFAPRRPEPSMPTMGRVVVRDAVAARLHTETEAASIRVSLHSVQPGGPRSDTQAERVARLTRSVAMRMLNRRLDNIALEEDAPFSRAMVTAYDRFDLFSNALVSLNTRKEDWRAAVATAENELRRALTFGFRTDELDEVRANLINAYEEAARRAPTRRSRDLAEQLLGTFSERTVFTDPASDLARMRPVLDEMNPAACLLALQEAFPENNRLLFVSGDLEITDADTTLLEVYRIAAAQPVDPPAAPEDRPFAYLDFGAPGTVEESVHVEDLDVRQVRFENGARLNLKRTDFAANEVLLSVRIGGGRLCAPESPSGLSLLATETFMAGGLGEHSADQLRRLFAGRNVGWSFHVAHDAFVFRGRTTPDDLETQLRLLTAYIVDPGYRDEALRLARDGFDEQYVDARHTARGVVRDRVASFLADGDTRFGLPPKEELLALDLDDVRRWLAGPLKSGYLEIAIVGDIGDAVIEHVAATLGALPGRNVVKEDFSGRRVLACPDGGGERRFEFVSRIPNALAAVYWPTTDMWNIERNRRLGILARVFTDRMRERIREEMGEAYSPYAVSETSSTYRDYGWLYGMVGVDPDKIGEVSIVIVDIAAELHGGNIDEDRLQRALRPVLTSLRDSVRDNNYWLHSVLADAQEFPQRLEWARTMAEDFESITCDDLIDLARRYLDPELALRIAIVPVEGQ